VRPSGTLQERRARWQTMKAAYRRDWSTFLYFETWLDYCHPIGHALFLGASICVLVGVLFVWIAIPVAVLALLGAPPIVAAVGLIVWLCFTLGGMVSVFDA
jgi:hypothetical protein